MVGLVRLLVLLVMPFAVGECVLIRGTGVDRSVVGGPASGVKAGDPRSTAAVWIGGVPTSGTTFAGSQRVLVRDRGGTLYLAYVKRIAGFDQVYVARSSDDGVSWMEFPQISSGPTRSSNPDLVIDRDGRLQVFWTKHALTNSPAAEQAAGEEAAREKETGHDVDGQLKGEASVKPGEPKPLESEHEEYETIRQLFSSVFDGRSWTQQEQITYGRYNGFPSAAYDSRGFLHLVWYGFDGELYQVMYSAWQGQGRTTPSQISVGYPDSVNPAIAVDSQDNLHVAWYQYSKSAKSYLISYRERSALSGEWGSQDQFSKDIETAMNVSIAVDRKDRVIVAWEGRLKAQEGSAIFLRVKDNGGWGQPIQLVPTAMEATEPSVAVDDSSHIYVFFQSAADRAIHLVRVEEGKADPQERLGEDVLGSYPNARWSFYGNPTTSRSMRIDYVWTEMGAAPGNPEGENLIRFGMVAAR